MTHSPYTLHCAGAAATLHHFPKNLPLTMGDLESVPSVTHRSLCPPYRSSQPFFFQNTRSLPVDIQTDRQNDDGTRPVGLSLLRQAIIVVANFVRLTFVVIKIFW